MLSAAPDLPRSLSKYEIRRDQQVLGLQTPTNIRTIRPGGERLDPSVRVNDQCQFDPIPGTVWKVERSRTVERSVRADEDAVAT